MHRRISVFVLILGLLFGYSAPAIATFTTDAAPTTQVTLDPAAPDGLAGWWRTAPVVSVSASQDATIHYTWSGESENTVGVSAGVPTVIGPAPEGVSVLTAFSVNAAEETETPAVITPTTTDSLQPDQPTGFAATPQAGPQVSLDWDDASDNGASGLSHYTVYRNLTGPPYSPADAIASPTVSEYVDTSVALDTYHYAVDARDNAGNQSLLSDSVTTVTDLDPPSQPQNLRAWKNASLWGRVLWEASVDVGSGLAYYRLERQIDAGPMVLLATVPAGTTFYNDFDPVIATAGTVRYQVTAVDRAGNWSVTTGPKTMTYDGTPPVLDGAPSATPLFAEGLGVTFDISWSAATDAGSGVLKSILRYGPDSGSPTVLLETDEDSVTLQDAAAAALWYFTLQAEDEAGNQSTISSEVAARYVSVERVWGADRLATSRALSQRAFASASTVVIASSRAFPDALCAASLAGAVDGPILLVGSGPIPQATVDELARLGATDAYVIGGTGAVSAQTMTSVADVLSGKVTRVAGPTRYETAAQVAMTVFALGGDEDIDSAFVVSGKAFPDALSAGAAAYASGQPILFATPTSVPYVTIDTLGRIGATECIIVGGSGAVSASAEELLPAATRVAGANRYSTSRAFAQWAEGEGILDHEHTVLATGRNFPDGLSASGHAGKLQCPVILTSDSQLGSTVDWHASRRADLEFVTISGGAAVVSDAIRDGIWEAASTP